MRLPVRHLNEKWKQLYKKELRKLPLGTVPTLLVFFISQVAASFVGVRFMSFYQSEAIKTQCSNLSRYSVELQHHCPLEVSGMQSVTHPFQMPKSLPFLTIGILEHGKLTWCVDQLRSVRRYVVHILQLSPDFVVNANRFEIQRNGLVN